MIKKEIFIEFSGPYGTAVNVRPEEVAAVRAAAYNTAIVLKSGTELYVREAVAVVTNDVTAAVKRQRQEK